MLVVAGFSWLANTTVWDVKGEAFNIAFLGMSVTECLSVLGAVALILAHWLPVNKER